MEVKTIGQPQRANARSPHPAPASRRPPGPPNQPSTRSSVRPSTQPRQLAPDPQYIGQFSTIFERTMLDFFI